MRTFLLLAAVPMLFAAPVQVQEAPAPAQVTARLEANGRFEREIARRSERFGNMVHAFSSYESRHEATDPIPFARGINSIQLSSDGNRWSVVPVLWESERPDNPLAPRYLVFGSD
jgi:hypothetical protein